MALKIRMSRAGTKHRPFFKIVIADSRKARDGAFVERVGSYNPMLQKDNKDRVILNVERVQYWLSKGATPSDRIAIFLHQAGLGPKPVITETPKKSAPKAKAQERATGAAEAAATAAEAGAQA